MGPKSSKKRIKKNKRKRFINGHLRLDRLYVIIPVVLILFITMKGTYAYINIINTKIDINKTEVTDVSIYKKTSGANNLYNPTFHDNKVSFNLCLSNKNDYITYLVTLKNYKNKDQRLNKVSLETTNNNSITYELESFNLNDTIKSSSGAMVKIKIKYLNELEKISNKCVGMTLKLDFIDN